MHDPGPVKAIRSVSILMLVGAVILGLVLIVSARETIVAHAPFEDDEITWNLARIAIGIAAALLGALAYALLQGFAAILESLASIARDVKERTAPTLPEQRG